MTDLKMEYLGLHEDGFDDAPSVNISLMIQEEGEEFDPYLQVMVGDFVCPYVADVMAVFESDVTNAENADITAEWLEHIASEIRSKWMKGTNGEA